MIGRWIKNIAFRLAFGKVRKSFTVVADCCERCGKEVTTQLLEKKELESIICRDCETKYYSHHGMD